MTINLNDYFNFNYTVNVNFSFSDSNKYLATRQNGLM